VAWLAPILVLGLVIFVHELGHLWAAKVFGVYAPRFSIGFGKALWRKRWGETEYVVALIPLGGYVRMASRDDEATNAFEGELEERKGSSEPEDPEAMVPFGPKPIPADRWFESKPLWQKAIILLAGVTMNVILAVVVSVSLFAVNGRQYIPPVLATVIDTMPAAQAGLRPGDSIVAVNGTAMPTWNAVVETVSALPGQEAVFEIMRGGTPMTLRVVPTQALAPDPATGVEKVVGRVGMTPVDRVVTEPVSFGTAIVLGSTATYRMGANVLAVLGGLVTGKVSVQNLGGPVAIARTSVEAARSGVQNLFSLIAFLSINLAILNLVPIPLLDGGQLLMHTAERIKGSAFSDTTREWIARAGLAAIGLLFITVMFNDLKALVMGWVR
jgi:regulator of sigma E protease